MNTFDLDTLDEFEIIDDGAAQSAADMKAEFEAEQEPNTPEEDQMAIDVTAEFR